MPDATACCEISESQLGSWKLLAEFCRVLGKVAPVARPRPAGGPERLLGEDDY